jgi:hypothetical protein
MAADHVGKQPGFVEKNQFRPITVLLPGLPLLSGHCDVFSFPFTGDYGFFIAIAQLLANKLINGGNQNGQTVFALLTRPALLSRSWTD